MLSAPRTQSFMRAYGCSTGLEDVFGPITGSGSFLKANWVIGFIYKKAKRKKERKCPLTVEGFQVSFSTFNMNLAHFSSHSYSELFDRANSDMPQTQKIIFSEDLILSTCSDASEHSEYTDFSVGIGPFLRSLGSSIISFYQHHQMELHK